MKKLYVETASVGSIYAAGNVVQNVLTVFLLPLYTSYLYPEDFGILALMGIAVSLITKLAISPVTSGLARFYYHPDYTEKKGILLGNLFFLLIVKTFFLGTLYWYFSDFFCRLIFNKRELIAIVKIYTLVLLFTPLSLFLEGFVRLRKMAKYSIFSSLANFILSFGLVFYLLVKLKLGILAIVYGNIFSLVFSVAISVPVFLKYAELKISPLILKEPLKYGYPSVFTGYSNLLFQSGDRYILRLLDSVNSVGVYSFGYRIASLIDMLFVSPLKQALFPLIYKEENNPKGQKKFLVNSATYFYLLGMFIALALSLFAKEIIMLLARREEFWQCWSIVPIIAFSYIQHSLGNFIGWGLIMRKKSYHISGILFVSAVVNIGLNFIFIPYWGIMGAAFATLISYFIWNGLKIYYSAKFYNLYFDLKRLSYIAIVGVSLYALTVFIAATDSLFFNIVIKFLIFFSYPFIFLLSSRFFTKKEREYIEKLWKSIKKKGLYQTYLQIKA
ncbi:MAG: oligosaccharide flippase family protein [Candidatus Omnitrophica bacterium]|nr:oligosaccharide flippase family protein [Candidatus Omnitrophota bacterium]